MSAAEERRRVSETGGSRGESTDKREDKEIYREELRNEATTSTNRKEPGGPSFPQPPSLLYPEYPFHLSFLASLF